MSRFLHTENLLKKDWIEENSLTGEVSSEESSSTGESLKEDFNLMEEDRIEESSLTEEVSSEESSSTGESLKEDFNLIEEDRIEENSLTEETSSKRKRSKEDIDLVEKDWIEENSLTGEVSSEESSSTGESSKEDFNLIEEDRIEENSLTEESSSKRKRLKEDINLMEKDWIEENSLTEEISSKGKRSKEDFNLMEEYRAEENSLTEEVSSEEGTLKSDSLIEYLNLIKTYLREEEENYLIKEHGLVFPKKDSSETKQHLNMQIVIIGSEDCGKTELIKTVFESHPSFTVENHSLQIKYRIYMRECSFHIWIYDAKETEFLSKSKFAKKTVFLFCHDADNPQSFTNIEETWIPPILEKSMEEMFYLLVSIKREPKTEPKAKKLKKEDRQMAIKVKAKELNDRFGAGKIIECFIEDKQSLLNVFQSAIDYVYPRF